MPPNLEPVYCVAALLAFVIAALLLGALWRHFQPREEFTPEESAALRRQGNVLGCGIISVWLFGGLLWGLSRLIPELTPYTLPLVMIDVFVVFIVAGAYLSIRSIRDRISIFRGRRQPFPRGDKAVSDGMGALVMIGVILVVVLFVITMK